MALDFVKDATSTLSWATLGYVGDQLHGASGVTAHCLVNVDGNFNGAATDNQILHVKINGTVAGLFLGVNGSVTPKVLKVGGRSQAADSFQSRDATSELTTGTWHACGNVMDLAGDTITPYVDGAAENGGAVTFGATTWTQGTATGADSIGGNGATSTAALQTDGRIAEMGIWAAALTAAEMAILAAGVSPLHVRPGALVFYAPLVRGTEELIGGESGALAGTGITVAAHARVLRVAPVALGLGAAAAPSTDVFVENRHPIAWGMKPQTAAGLNGVLIA